MLLANRRWGGGSGEDSKNRCILFEGWIVRLEGGVMVIILCHSFRCVFFHRLGTGFLKDVADLQSVCQPS